MGKREDIAEAKRNRKVLLASLELSEHFEFLRKKHKLNAWQAVEVLQEQTQLYLNIAIGRARGKR